MILMMLGTISIFQNKMMDSTGCKLLEVKTLALAIHCSSKDPLTEGLAGVSLKSTPRPWTGSSVSSFSFAGSPGEAGV